MSLNDLLTVFFSQAHVLLILVQTLPWIDLLRFRHMPSYEAGHVVGEELRRRVFLAWIGFITGDVVREVFLLNHEKITPPWTTTLTIIVNKCDISPLQLFLKELGYVLIPWDDRSREVDTRKRLNVVAVLEHYRRVDSSGEEYFIVLMVSNNEALTVLMAIDNTADMVAISHDTIVSFYPRLIFANEGILTNTAVKAGDSSSSTVMPDEEYEDFELHFNNHHWTKPCGPYCPEILRCTYDDEGTMKIHWDGAKGNQVDQEKLRRLEEKSQNEIRVSVAEVRALDEPHDVGSPDASQELQSDDWSQESGSNDGPQESSSEDAKTTGLNWEKEGFAGAEGDVGAGEDMVRGWGMIGPDDTWGRGWGTIAFWNSGRARGDFTYSEILQWRITNRCANTHCRNSELHDLRAHQETSSKSPQRDPSFQASATPMSAALEDDSLLEAHDRHLVWQWQRIKQERKEREERRAKEREQERKAKESMETGLVILKDRRTGRSILVSASDPRAQRKKAESCDSNVAPTSTSTASTSRPQVQKQVPMDKPPADFSYSTEEYWEMLEASRDGTLSRSEWSDMFDRAVEAVGTLRSDPRDERTRDGEAAGGSTGDKQGEGQKEEETKSDA
ncbi:hypothetical protein NMY22_g16897 [Coprinellus aureogranulatus]|nr:hypothetical protein NMY22_g16897 [Coprinellus aureogranulatus]